MNNEDKSALSYARSWVRRSPGPDAWSNLAAVYATKEPPDLKRARSWYRRAALKGHDRGLFEYGLMLIQGEGGPKRPAQGGVILSAPRRWGKSMRSRCWRTHFRKVTTVISRRAPELNRSNARCDALSLAFTSSRLTRRCSRPLQGAAAERQAVRLTPNVGRSQ